MTPSTKAAGTMALVGVIDPDAYAAATYETTWIEARKFNQFQALVLAGTLGASATLDAKIQQAQDGAGTGVKDVAGKAIAQLTQAGTDSDKQTAIDLSPEELDTDNAFTHFRLSMTVGTATSDAGAVVHGLFPVYGPASDHDLTTVDQIVA